MIRNEIVELKNQRDQFATRLQVLVQTQNDYLSQLTFTDPPVVEEMVDAYELGRSEEADGDDATD